MNATKKQTIINHLIAKGFAIKDANCFESVRARFYFAANEVALFVFVGQSRSMIDFEVRLADTTPLSIITANIDAAAQFTCRNTAPLCR